ncbi:MAG: VCBS repeat-containing protein [Saprospiraceae bacterium]
MIARKGPSIFIQLIAFSAIVLNISCKGDNSNTNSSPLFVEKSAEETGLTFNNELIEDQQINIVTYEYLYNGGGVGIADINNDGLPDILFTGTKSKNKLFLNKGKLKFEDISESAGIADHLAFGTGVTFVDINQDGYQDIYLCQTGYFSNAARRNLLYINQKNNTFVEQALQYGLADESYSNHAVFFDYDRDGDLDLYLANHPSDFKYANSLLLSDTTKQYVSGRLYKNNGNLTFTDVSKLAGIDHKAYSFCANIIDVNNDSWPDIYVSNDYLQPDFLFVNQKNGTFKEEIASHFKHTCMTSMGNAIGDVNNDGLMDVMTLDMMPADNYRKKVLSAAIPYDSYLQTLQVGYLNQFPHNCLQLNRGGGNYSEIAALSNIHETDWSWGCGLVDLDLDGYQDIFVTNGYLRDITNQDFQRYYLDSIKKSNIKLMFDQLMSAVPKTPLLNVVFKNNQDLSFTNKSKDWGIVSPTYGNGLGEADFDLDGDIDVVVNNLNDFASFYENKSIDQNSKLVYYKVKLEAPSPNRDGIGANVQMTSSKGLQMQAVRSTSSIFSSSASPLSFGMNEDKSEVSIQVFWPDGKIESYDKLERNKLNILSKGKGVAYDAPPSKPNIFQEITDQSGLDFVHKENAFLDFKETPTISQKFSIEGPALAAGDVNADRLEDIFLGGASGQSAALYLQNSPGSFQRSASNPWAQNALQEDVSATFFDIDNDKDLDLYVVCGGSEWTAGSAQYQDRLYINDSRGNFAAATIPQEGNSGSCVVSGDLDNDGDLDLFVGSRLVPGSYPKAAASMILINDHGKLINATKTWAPFLDTLGMVTSAVMADIDGDKRLDLMIVGQWMAPTFLKNTGKSLVKPSASTGLEHETGWWYSVAGNDVDNDGDIDFVAGNMGVNSRLKASAKEPASIYAADWDDNGTFDPLLCYYIDGKSYPLHNRDQLTDQIRPLRKKFLRYAMYGNAGIEDIFTKAELDKALVLKAQNFHTSFIENLGKGKFKIHALPALAQISPVKGICFQDLNGDKLSDIILSGNGYEIDYETGRFDAAKGLVLINKGKGNWELRDNTGLNADRDSRTSLVIGTEAGKRLFILANNNSRPQVYGF